MNFFFADVTVGVSPSVDNSHPLKTGEFEVINRLYNRNKQGKHVQKWFKCHSWAKIMVHSRPLQITG